jgi:hypothetical protein
MPLISVRRPELYVVLICLARVWIGVCSVRGVGGPHGWQILRDWVLAITLHVPDLASTLSWFSLPQTEPRDGQ